MSSACSKGPGHMPIRGTDSSIADRQISAVADSPSSEGLKRSAALTRAGSHGAMFGKGLVAGFGIPVWLAGGLYMNRRKEPHRLQQEGDGFSAYGNVPDCGSLASLADQLQEGKLNMLFHRNHKSGPVRSAGRILLAAFLAAVLAGSTVAQTSRSVRDVTAVSLEDLWNMQVTSVSKRTQKVADAAAAIFVITQADIRRSGATSIPEALRLVPGLEVARIDQNKWAIGSRGFNGRFDNKLLVLIDGRSVYTPLFSGVYWNVQDVMLEDVDRIEVIRGPGATLWGANAVDGVINVITKPAQATQGGLVTAEGGTEERTAESVRYGGKLGNSAFYRIYSKYFEWEPSIDATGKAAHDGWNAVRAGFRVDTKSSGPNALTVQGDLYDSDYKETLTIPSLNPPYSSMFANDGDYAGGNLLGRWNHSFSRSSTTLQVYFDRTNVLDNSLFTDHESVYDIDFQHDIHVGESQELVWGMGYRSIQDSNGSSFTVSLQPNHSSLNQFSSFLQDEVSFFDRRLRVTLGSKFEHNDFTGFEFQPNVRVLANIGKNQSDWAATSRAVRTPALTE